MTRKKESFFELLIAAPWWVGISGAVFFFISSYAIKHIQITMFHLENAFSPLLKLLAFLFALGGIFSFITALMKGTLFAKTKNLSDIKAISWQDFESLIGEYYRRKGYSVFEMGGDSPDGGIDLFAKKNGEKLVIQCKHWKAFKIDVKVVREVYGVMVDATASGAAIITSGQFTQPAIDFAQDKPIELIDGPKLARLISEVKAASQKPSIPVKIRATLIPTDPPPLTKEENDRKYMPPAMRAEVESNDKAFVETNPVCPHCKKAMVLRVAHKGPHPGAKFWGCPSYPACRHTMSYTESATK